MDLILVNLPMAKGFTECKKLVCVNFLFMIFFHDL